MGLYPKYILGLWEMEYSIVVPSVAPYAGNLYARLPLKLMFALDGGELEMVDSARKYSKAASIWVLFA